MREEIKEYKRARIIEEASKLFYQHGYEATSLDMLAGALSVTKPFIYSYFDSKRSILEAMHEQAALRVFSYIEDAIAGEGSPADRLRAFIKAYVNENIKHQIASGIYLQEEKNLSEAMLERVREIERSFNRELTQLIEQGVAAKQFHTTDPKIASLCLSGMVRWVHRWYHPTGPLEPEQIAERIADLGLSMVGYEEAQR